MGNHRTQHDTPAPSSAEGIDGQPRNRGIDTASVSSSPKQVLPKDLPKALGYLDDRALDRLLGAAIDETRRRGRSPPGSETSPAKTAAGSGEPFGKQPAPKSGARRRQEQIVQRSLTRGQINAVRAAFKAGITPPRIARQFGLTQANVRKALASDETK